MTQRLRYYHAHEPEYVRRLNAGQVGWDPVEYDAVPMKPFVGRCLERSAFNGRNAKALELGCGTGALSCYLAEEGLAVTGLDVSPSAIAFAQRQAEHRRLDVAFAVSDVCADPLPPGPFQVVVDGHLLHCVVFESERVGLLAKVAASLADDGEFWVETMLREGYREPDSTWHLDWRGALWVKCKHGVKYAEAIERDGDWWLPQRYLASSSEQVQTELVAAGMRVIEQECCPPTEPDAPGSLRARCGKA